MANTHYDYVGSFLRPKKLKDARSSYNKGIITKEELKNVEDECIKELVVKLKDLGYKSITDGEFRRATWHLDFMWGFSGVGHKKTINGLPFHGEAALIDDTYLIGKFELKDEHPFVDHFRFLKQFEDENTKARQTIPSPAQTLAQFWMTFNRENTLKYYKTLEELKEDIVNGYNVFINQLYELGCRCVQFDDCTWGMLADKSGYLAYGVSREDTIKVQKEFLDINNKVIKKAPKDLIINTHVCRGNYHSTYANSGAYDSVADVLFGLEDVDTYYLEFDDERSGGFESLSKVSNNKKVVLGLITTKSPKLEDKEYIKKRIEEASKYIPLERLSLSPQCGFASCEIGNKLSEEEQWNKLKLVEEIAKEVW